MSRLLRFLLPLLLVLAAFTWLTSWVVERTSRQWFARDVSLRARLVAQGAKVGLIPALTARDARKARAVLTSITRDERLMAAVLCDADGRELARTELLPSAAECARVPLSSTAEARARADVRVDVPGLTSSHLQLSLVPLADDDHVYGTLGLVHDMSFAERRAGVTRWFVVAALAFLAIAASATTLILLRVTWRRWTEEIRRALRGGAHGQEFRPLLTDVRELAARLAEDSSLGAESSRWGPDRLRRVLHEHLQGERVLIVANREPYIHERTPEGPPRVVHPASGLVTALEPIMKACSGVWIAHGSGSADRETADARGRLRVPPGDGSYGLRRVWLSKEEEQGYYYGFANEGMWPLCHVAHTRPIFRADDWRHYKTVNQRFASAAIEESSQDDPVVLVQDYHFAMAPAMIRAKLPRATVLTFWHIPWPNAERLAICPWQRELLDGLLGSSIIGFHTQGHCNNFLEAVDRYLEARIDREAQAVIQGGRMTLVRPYPISVDWPNPLVAQAPPIDECRRQVLADLGLRDDALLGIGVDRLDYTKGIEERLLAVEHALERHPELVGRFTFVQLAAPSRTTIEAYRLLNEAVEALAKKINDRFASGSYRPVILLREHHEPPKVFRYYRAADVCYVSSLHDGMNLVAKEFVSARDDERGVLVLSRFTGAAKELTEALIVNPYDIEEASAALHRALTMPAVEQAARIRAMRGLVADLNVYRWAGRMLVDAARLRRRDRLSSEMGVQPRLASIGYPR
jgi:trehalose 6-phosphate synthase